MGCQTTHKVFVWAVYLFAKLGSRGVGSSAARGDYLFAGGREVKVNECCDACRVGIASTPSS